LKQENPNNQEHTIKQEDTIKHEEAIKQESFFKKQFKNALYPPICLALLCLLVALSIAGTYAVTSERIAPHHATALFNSMERLIVASEYDRVFYDETTGCAIYHALSDEGYTKGHLILTSIFGYSGEVLVLTAITEGQVLAIEIVDATGETPGLGQNILDPDFKDEFRNLTVIPTLIRDLPTEHGEIQALTGATISAQAVVDAVALAMELYEFHISSR
jgi:electron transport complex protein RnfG